MSDDVPTHASLGEEYPKQQARVREVLAHYEETFALPNGVGRGCAFAIAVTMNFRSWLNFISLRAKSPPAHPDIAPLAQAIQKILVEKAKTVFAEEQV